MKKFKEQLVIFITLIATSILYAQVGINTADPKSILDVNGNVKIRTVPALASLTSSQTILVRDNSVAGDNEIKEINSDFLVTGNANAYYASKSGAWSLLDLGLGNSWYKVNLTGSANTKLGNAAHFTAGVYTAPQAGVYAVDYEFQLAAGVDLEVLGGKKLGILKNGTTVWDEKLFDAVRVQVLTVTLAAVPVTSTKMTSLVQLAAGDTLTFAVNTSGILPINLGVLTNGKVSLYIYKISN